jgi:NAD-dependent dihydropyrimidine dehydrogenase PreA subunit
MKHFEDRPIPLIDPQKCDGCGLCVHACPTKALGLQDGKAVVADHLACEYSGLCEAVCPVQAITRPFEIVVACADVEITHSKTTKVVEKGGLPVYNESNNKI